MKTSQIICVDCGNFTSVTGKKRNSNILRCDECAEKYFREITNNPKKFSDNVIKEA